MDIKGVTETSEAAGQRPLVIEITDDVEKETPNGKFSLPKLNLKYASLIFLALQNAILVPGVRYTRVRDVNTMYLTSVSVVVGEGIKLTISVIAILIQERFSLTRFVSTIYDNIITQPGDTLKISVLSCIYVVTNNLLYIAVSSLEAATYQVSVQLKILTTAMWSVIILRKELSKTQWLSLLLLAGGVALVQLQHSHTSLSVKDLSTYQPTKGILAVVSASVMTGFAGVYFEKVLKSTPQSIWIRNVQLGSIGLIISTVAAYAKDGPLITENGFLQGFDIIVWSIITWNSIGAFLTVMAVKYADNILKGFATSVAIIISSFICIKVFNFVLNIQFIFGAGLVILSIYLYNRFAKVSTADG